MNAIEIFGALRQEITSKSLRDSDRLPPERELAQRFGVARGTVREALRQLETNGFVERRAGSGTYVVWKGEEDDQAIIEQTRPLQLIEVRRGLEPHMARLAVLHANASDLEVAENYLHAMERCGDDSERFADADERFHLALADCGQNPLLKLMMMQVHKVRTHRQWARMRTLTLSREMMELYNRQHREVFDAIRARDADGAADAMRRHIDTARRSLEDATR